LCSGDTGPLGARISRKKSPGDGWTTTAKPAVGDALLVSGHNPGLGDMLFELVAPQKENALYDEDKVNFPTAAYAVFELDIEDWSE